MEVLVSFMITDDKTCRSGTRLYHSRFRVGIRKKIFTVKVVKNNFILISWN